MLRNNITHDHWVKVLTGEDVQIDIVRLLYEMRADIGSLNQLDQRVALLVSSSKHDNLGLAISNHVNLLHQILAEMVDGLRAADRMRSSASDIKSKMTTPHFVMYMVSCENNYPFSR